MGEWLRVGIADASLTVMVCTPYLLRLRQPGQSPPGPVKVGKPGPSATDYTFRRSMCLTRPSLWRSLPPRQLTRVPLTADVSHIAYPTAFPVAVLCVILGSVDEHVCSQALPETAPQPV